MLRTTLTLNGPGVSRTSLLQDVSLAESRSGIACLTGGGTPSSAVIAISTLDLNDPNASAVPVSAGLPGQTLRGPACASGTASTGVDPSALADDDAVVYNNIAITFAVTINAANAPSPTAAALRVLRAQEAAPAQQPPAALPVLGGGHSRARALQGGPFDAFFGGAAPASVTPLQRYSAAVILNLALNLQIPPPDADGNVPPNAFDAQMGSWQKRQGYPVTQAYAIQVVVGGIVQGSLNSSNVAAIAETLLALPLAASASPAPAAAGAPAAASLPAIIGGAVAGGLVVAGLIAAAVLSYRRRRRVEVAEEKEAKAAAAAREAKWRARLGALGRSGAVGSSRGGVNPLLRLPPPPQELPLPPGFDGHGTSPQRALARRAEILSTAALRARGGPSFGLQREAGAGLNPVAAAAAAAQQRRAALEREASRLYRHLTVGGAQPFHPDAFTGVEEPAAAGINPLRQPSARPATAAGLATAASTHRLLVHPASSPRRASVASHRGLAVGGGAPSPGRSRLPYEGELGAGGGDDETYAAGAVSPVHWSSASAAYARPPAAAASTRRLASPAAAAAAAAASARDGMLQQHARRIASQRFLASLAGGGGGGGGGGMSVAGDDDGASVGSAVNPILQLSPTAGQQAQRLASQRFLASSARGGGGGGMSVAGDDDNASVSSAVNPALRLSPSIRRTLPAPLARGGSDLSLADGASVASILRGASSRARATAAAAAADGVALTGTSPRRDRFSPPSDRDARGGAGDKDSRWRR